MVIENTIGDEVKFVFDPDKMREVVINLVHNAIKYTSNAKVTVHLEKTDDKNIRLSVCDGGMGIKKEDLSRLFTKFVRTDEAKASDPNGMGIGLYFVKRVVEDHGGRVGVESEGMGKGSIFTVELPLER